MRCPSSDDAVTPAVSIGLPVYNGEAHLAEALDSLLAQTFSDFELIISDNASTDRTAEICRAYAARDPRIRYTRQEQNRGAAWNYNRVFALASGRYFKWFSHDDLCSQNYFERCVEILERDPAVVLSYGKTTLVDESGERALLMVADGGGILAPSLRALRLAWTEPAPQ